MESGGRTNPRTHQHTHISPAKPFRLCVHSDCTSLYMCSRGSPPFFYIALIYQKNYTGWDWSRYESEEEVMEKGWRRRMLFFLVVCWVALSPWSWDRSWEAIHSRTGQDQAATQPSRAYVEQEEKALWLCPGIQFLQIASPELLPFQCFLFGIFILKVPRFRIFCCNSE